MGITAAITAFCEMVKEFFGFKTTETVYKPTTEIVKEKKSLKKASNYTEKIIEIVDKYTNVFSPIDLRKYKSLKRKFLKNN